MKSKILVWFHLIMQSMIIHGYRVNETGAPVHGNWLVDIWIMGVVSEGMDGCNCLVFNIVIMDGSCSMKYYSGRCCNSGN